MAGLGWVNQVVRTRQVRSLICSIYFELPDPVGGTLAEPLRRQLECRMCSGSATDLLTMPVWELQGAPVAGGRHEPGGLSGRLVGVHYFRNAVNIRALWTVPTGRSRSQTGLIGAIPGMFI